MDYRKILILNTIIDEYIKNCVPVSSGILAERYKLGISSATIRNEMSALEEDGYIIQPHTSAGRIPTEKAYQKYINNLDKKELNKKEKQILKNILKNKDEDSFKKIAKLVSKISGNTVFCAFHKHNLYYTGISNLFQQPEFEKIDLIHNFSSIIDSFDEIVDNIFEQINYGENVLLGSNNPFGNFCGTVLLKYKLNNKTGIFGILGPIRMNYKNNIAIIKYINSKL